DTDRDPRGRARDHRRGVGGHGVRAARRRGELAADVPPERARRVPRAHRFERADPDLGDGQRRGQDLDVAARARSGRPAHRVPAGPFHPARRLDGRRLDRRARLRGPVPGAAAARLPRRRRRPGEPPLDRDRGGPQQPRRAGRAQGHRRTADGAGQPGDDVRRLGRGRRSGQAGLRLRQRGAAVVRAAAPRLPGDPDRGGPRPAGARHGHAHQGRLGAHHVVGARDVPARAHRLQADQAATADDPAHGHVDLRRDRRGGRRHLAPHRRPQRGQHPGRAGPGRRRAGGARVRPRRTGHQQPGHARSGQGVRRAARAVV
ncbi:MAG: Aromatase, partial [uncultured Pseudonocardia sp.]